MQPSPYTLPALIVSVAVLLAPLVSYCVSYSVGESPKSSTYQAVFLGKGDIVYYGRLTGTGSTFSTLEDVYYLRQNQPVVDPKTGEQVAPKAPIDLVKYGNIETYKPEDTIHIPTEQILYWTNLDAKSPVLSAIEKAKSESQPEKK